MNDSQMQLSHAPWGGAWPGVGATLMQTPPPNDGTSLDGTTGPLPFRARLGAALRGLGGTLNPNGGGVESLLSGLSGGYTGTADAMQQARLGPRLAQEQQYTQGLDNQRTIAQTGYYNRLGTGVDTPPDPYTFNVVPGLGVLRGNRATGESGLVGPDGGDPYVVPIPGVETQMARPATPEKGNPDAMYYQRILHQNLMAKNGLGLPTYKSQADAEAAAQQATRQAYPKTTLFGAASGGSGSTGQPKRRVTAAEYQTLQAQYPGQDLSAYYTVTP